MPFHLHKFVSGCKQLAKWKRLALISWLHWYGIVLTEEEAPLPQGAALRFLRARSHLLRSHECSPPGSSVHGIPQARILEWVVISSSRGSSPAKDRTCLSCTGQVDSSLSHLGSPLRSNRKSASAILMLPKWDQRARQVLASSGSWI